MNRPIVLGHEEIDEIHAEFEVLLDGAKSCTDAQLYSVLDVLIAHLSSHFSMEDALMADGKFPAGDCHIAEHAAVLQSAEEVRPLVAAGNIQIGRSFVKALSDWFPVHATHLDSALATWICQQRLGAKPLVFHRS